jgi:hypothetical protein
MQLHEFITETLVQIAKGVENANSQLKGSSAIINPRHVNYNNNEHVRAYGWLTEKKEKLRAVHLIEFDVAVKATEGKENKGGIGVSMGAIGLVDGKKWGRF